MSFRRCLMLPMLLIAGAAPLAAQGPAAADPVDFQRDVRPILSDNCFQCHGPDQESRKAGLRLDTRDGAFAERRNGPTIAPGDAAASLLFQRITHENLRRRMPPASTNKSLTPEQIDVLRTWIDDGATWDQHWAFEPVARAEPPAVANEAWVRNPLDRFVLARLEAEGLAPAEEADKRTLARRVALDLTGLPPDPGTLARFLEDSSEDAYETLVDTLLASPHWGEHRARYWLDAARYGDTHGFHIDNYREMFPYRDWVIRAYNDNEPFDRFTIEQVAGDLLPDPTLDQLVATGFQRNNITTDEGGVIPEEFEAIYAKDRAETIGSVFLGLTVGCATCHDHKFDPIAQRDFYALTAFFRNTTQYVMDGNVSDPPPTVVVPSAADRERWAELRELDSEIAADLGARGDYSRATLDDWLAGGAHRSLAAPLGEATELMALDFDGEPAVVRDGERTPVTLHDGAAAAEGPQGLPALRFEGEGWAELPALPVDSDTPFSLAMWIFQPEGEGGFEVLGQHAPDQPSRGWAITVGDRYLVFRLTGDKPGGGGPATISVSPITTKRLTAGEWTHIVVSYDGTGERAGLQVYRDGAVIEQEGSEYFAAIAGSIRTDGPLMLGRGLFMDGDTQQARDFAGGGIADFRAFNRALTPLEVKAIAAWPLIRRARSKAAAELEPEEREALAAYYLAVEDAEVADLLARRREIDLEWREIRRRGAVTHVMQERIDSEPEAHVLFRGMYDQPRDLVAAATPSVLPPMSGSWPRNRMGLARWLVDESNPLTSRVTVNRYWQQVFGTGLVRTAEDFGSQGEPPSNPELLDWLASEYRDTGWDTKQFFRMLVTSATYRQSAQVTPEKLERDPENRLLSRGPRFRMDAEMIRDYALAASGLLVRRIGGPSVKPYQPPGVWETVAMPASNTRVYERDSGENLYRRSLYTFWKRSAPPASMDIFNAPTREHTTVRRERTNTPLQALVTMNDTQFVEAARVLAQRAMREAGDDFDRRLDYVTMRLLARDFTDEERAVARRTYDGLLERFGASRGKAGDLLTVGEFPPDEALPVVDSAAWTMLTSELMNLDEVLNK